MSLMERFGNILSRPGAVEALTGILNREDRGRERKKDKERARLRREREAVLDELALGRAALLAGVREAERDVAQAEVALRAAKRKRGAAAQELSRFETALSHRATSLEKQIAMRPIGVLAGVRDRLYEVRRKLDEAQPRDTYDAAWHWRADQLAILARDIEALEDGDSERAEIEGRHLVAEMASIVR